MHMSEVVERRRRAIADLIRSRAPSSQEELGALLEQRGFAVTQATISRDLEHLGAVKLRRESGMSYVLGGAFEPFGPSGPGLSRLLADWVSTIECALNLVVIKTPPGSAHLIGAALDQGKLAQVVGTVSGDDTIFVACRGVSEAAELAEHLDALRTGSLQ